VTHGSRWIRSFESHDDSRDLTVSRRFRDCRALIIPHDDSPTNVNVICAGVHCYLINLCCVLIVGVNQLVGFNSGLSRPLLPDATLVLSSAHCNPIEVSVTVSLSGYDIDQTCQLDTTSLAIQRKICGKRRI